MKRPHASLAQLRRSLSWLLALLTGSACERSSDCKLYGTCAGSLLELTDTFADSKRESCRRCLKTHCTAEEQRCSIDIACNFTSRCTLTKSPSDYQDCLRALYEGGLTIGNERRHPWEGRQTELDVGGDRTFGECLHEHCRPDCIEDPFACAKTFADDQSYSEYDIRVEVAVRSYPEYTRMPNVSLQACEDVPDRQEPGKTKAICEKAGVTDARGVASLKVRQHIKAEALYFVIDGQPGDFPKTLYYPGRLGSDDLQLVPIYIVKSYLIEFGNEELRRGRIVLKDSAQSLILTDSCVWEKISVPALRVSVEDASVPQCHDLKDRGPCDEDAGCTPCVWYAIKRSPDEGFPDFNAERTDGTGAGIVGLNAGFYTIRVDRGKDERVGGRTVRMENGAMTIVRTWPPFEPVPSSSPSP